jgi:hypothetical protein
MGACSVVRRMSVVPGDIDERVRTLYAKAPTVSITAAGRILGVSPGVVRYLLRSLAIVPGESAPDPMPGPEERPATGVPRPPPSPRFEAGTVRGRD